MHVNIPKSFEKSSGIVFENMPICEGEPSYEEILVFTSPSRRIVSMTNSFFVFYHFEFMLDQSSYLIIISVFPCQNVKTNDLQVEHRSLDEVLACFSFSSVD